MFHKLSVAGAACLAAISGVLVFQLSVSAQSAPYAPVLSVSPYGHKDLVPVETAGERRLRDRDLLIDRRCDRWNPQNCRGYWGFGITPRRSSDHVNWCLDRYRSYNPRTDTFVTYGGEKRRCNSPYD